MPERIQLRRTKGWRLPEGAVVVARPTRWGNPYRVLRHGDGWMVRGNGQAIWAAEPSPDMTRREAAEWAVDKYRAMYPPGSNNAYEARILLAGHDLACWCPPGMPCHADVLLELANEEGL
jgi:hypothetical protein